MAMAPSPGVAAFLEGRARLVAETPGEHLASECAHLADEMVASLAAEAVAVAHPGRPWAVIALGGYGAGRLLPFSDVDLLVASEASPERLKPFVSALIYPMWDAGLKVGHSVRGKKDALAAAADDPANLTAMLTGRFVAGSPAVAESVLAAVARRAGRGLWGARGVLGILGGRPRPGSPYELWPDLKEGRGGQRDLDEIAWTASAMAASPAVSLSTLVDAGLLSGDEVALLADTQNIITTARWVTHLSHGRGDNRYDEDVAADLPLDDALLQTALVDVDEVLSRLRERLAATAPRRRPGVTPKRPQPVPDGPMGVLWALGEGTARLPEVEGAASAGALDPAIPGWSDLMVLRRPSLSHELTVGAHSMAAAALVREVCDTDPRAGAMARAPGDRVVLVAAALLHDIGKRSDTDDHSLAGAPVAREAAFRLGLSGPDAAKVAALVRHHLLLAETASNEDLDDEDVVLDVASRLLDPDLAGALYVLTQVDARATGPGVWTPWKAALIGELAGKVERVLRGGTSAEVALRASVVRAEVMEIARFEPVGRSVAEFARHAPLRYLAEHTPDEVVDHARLTFSLSQGGRHDAAGLEVRADSLEGTWRVTIVAVDRPGLLALLSGVVALSGLDILAVSAHTTSRRVALDTFTVTGATLAEVGPSTWARLERSLHAALAGRLAVPTRLAERRGHYRSAERSIVPRVRIAADSDFATSFAVRAADRVGLLHDLALALSRVGFDIRGVTALTSDGVAHDTFRVVDGFGEPVRDAAIIEQARTALLAAADGNPPREDARSEEST